MNLSASAGTSSAAAIGAVGKRPPRLLLRPRGVAILSAFASALLTSAPRSDAFLALPSEHGGLHARGNGCGGAVVKSFAATRPMPTSTCAAPGRVCSSHRNSRRSRNGGSTPIMMSGVHGGEEAGDGEALVEGEEAGGVVEGVISRSPASASGQGGQEGRHDDDEAAASPTSIGDTDGSGKQTGRKKGKTASGGGAKKTKKNAAPRLEGDALRDELMRRERREEERVLAVNELFYRSRAYNEIEDLKRVWDKSDLSECIRSVGGALKGYDNIIEEYKTDFVLAQKQEKPGLRPFKVKNIKVQTCGTLAWVTCIEDMRSPYKPQPKSVQLVTNIYRKTSSGWRLTRHHASDRDVSIGKPTSKASRQLSGGEGIQMLNPTTKVFRVVGGEMKPFDLDIGSISDDDDDMDDDEEEEDITDEIGREIASQIFLNYGDLFDGKEGTTEIPLGEINFLAGKGGGGGGSGSDALDETLPPAMRKRIEDAMEAKLLKKRKAEANQRFENIYNLNEGLKEVTGGSASKPAVDKWQDASTNDGGAKSWLGSISGSSSGGGGAGEAGGDADSASEGRGSANSDDGGESGVRHSRDLSRKTVDALRVLADMGRISDGEKTVLLADVIRNKASPKPSMTEVAYAMLVDGDVTPEGIEYTHKADEFAEQCKSITLQLQNEQSNSNRRRWWKFWTKPQWVKFWAKDE
ncbi:unnamed protein product [Scytosiphon promiscuus]